LAIASLVSSLLIPVWPVSSIVAIILGGLALRQMRTSLGLGGRGLAIAGIIVGACGLDLLLLILGAIVWLGHECRNGC
jgi:uncharacterized protein DUF4190